MGITQIISNQCRTGTPQGVSGSVQDRMGAFGDGNMIHDSFFGVRFTDLSDHRFSANVVGV